MQIISASINLSLIDKSKIQKLDKHGNPFKNGAQYYNFDILVNDDFDQYGNNVQLVEKQTKEDRVDKVKRVFLGNGKRVWMSPATPVTVLEGGQTNSSQAASDDDLPF